MVSAAIMGPIAPKARTIVKYPGVRAAQGRVAAKCDADVVFYTRNRAKADLARIVSG